MNIKGGCTIDGEYLCKDEISLTTNVSALTPQSETLERTQVLTLSVIQNPQEFDDLEKEWNDVLDKSPPSSVFQSFEWLRTWWRHFAETNPRAILYLIVLRENDKTVAIAPFYIEVVRVLGLASVRKLTFIGQPISDYLDVLVAEGYEASAAELIAQHFAGNRAVCDLIHLDDIPERSRMHSLLYEAFSKRGIMGSKFVNEVCPRMELLGSWEKTLTTFSANGREDNSRKWRKIMKSSGSAFEEAGKGEVLESEIREFAALHQAQWNRRGFEGILGDDRRVDFIQEIARRFQKRGWLFLVFLRVNGERVAANMTFHYNNVFYFYVSGMRLDEHLSKLSPGRVLHLYSMQEAIRRNATVYDFLRGSEDYKYRLNASDISNWTLLLYPGESRRIAAKFKAHLLIESLKRRTSRELLKLQSVADESGWFSFQLIKHIVSSSVVNMQHAIAKLRAPHKQVRMQGRSNQSKPGKTNS